MVDKITFESPKKQVEDTLKRSAIDEKSVIQEVDKILMMLLKMVQRKFILSLILKNILSG